MITNEKTFYVNSKNRTSGTDCNFEYKIQLPNNQKFDRVCLTGAEIPKSYYLIQSGRNTFTLEEKGQSITITLQVGNIGRNAFKSMLQTALNAATTHAWVYVVATPASTQSETGKFTFTVSGNDAQPSFIFTDYLYEQMGFDANTTNTFVADSLVSSNVVNFQLENCLFLHSNICTNGSDDVLQEFYVSANTDFSAVTYTSPSPEAYSKKLSTQVANSYHFSLTNEDGVLMDLNGQNINFTIKVYKKDDVHEMIKLAIKQSVIT